MEKHRLLFVDDEDNILLSLSRLFQDAGYEIYTAKNGMEGIKILSDYEFSLILSDYRMPEMNGVEFLKVAKEKSPDTIRMILTGFADIDTAISAINEGGVYKFIEKPWEEENIKVQIKRAIEHYELVKERKKLLDKIKKQNEELKEWNVKLEQKVKEKTNELQTKIMELEGRDTILQYLLTVHSFEDTLNLIVDVILDIVKFDRIIIYCIDKGQKLMFPKAGCILKDKIKVRMSESIVNIPPMPISKIETKIKSDSSGGSKPVNIHDHTYGVPIEKDDKLLGMIIVDNSDTRKVIDQSELKSIAGFASLAALAISDYLVTSELPDLQWRISELLGE